jgi:gliding motility-associated-like protein
MKSKGSTRICLLFILQFWLGTAISQGAIFPPVGNAVAIGNDCYQLTQNMDYIMGAIWFDPQINLNEPYDIRVNLNFGSNFFWDGSDVTNIYPEATGGADGIAFVMQQVDSAAGDVGEAMGYGLLDPSLTVEFDSYYNFNADPIYDHVAISYSGNHVHTTAPYGDYSEGALVPGANVQPLLGTDPVADNVHTGLDYPARFKWDPATSTLEVWFNCQLKISYTDNMFIDTIFNNNPNVYYGFTSATGSEFNEHTVCVLYNSTTFDIPDETICIGDNVQLDGTLPNAPVGTTYSWSPATGLSNPNISDPIASPNSTTEYVLTIMDPCYPDPIYDTVLVTVNAGNSVAVNPVGPFCDSDAPVILMSNGGSANWSGTGITNASTGEFSPIVAGAGTHTIYFDEIGFCGGADTITIDVNPSSSVTINNAGPYCVGDADENLTNSGVSGVWSGTGITNPVLGTFSPATAGIGLHQIIYIENGTCSGTDTIDIQVDPLNPVSIATAGPYCNVDADVNLVTTGIGGVWSGNGLIDLTNGVFSPSAAGQGFHTIYYSDPGACGGIDSIVIEVNLSIPITINPSGPFCENEADQSLTANVPGGEWSGTGIVDVTNGIFSSILAGVGSHQVSYSIAGNCPTSDTITILVNQLAVVLVDPAGPFCTTDQDYNLLSNGGAGTWTGPGIIDPANGVFSPSSAGAGMHIVYFHENVACGGSDSIIIEVGQTTNINIVGAGPFCTGDPNITLNANATGGEWSGNGILNPQTGSFSPTTSGVGNHQIIYSITGLCPSSDTIIIAVDEAPVPMFVVDSVSGCAPLTVTFADLTQPSGVNCMWDFGDGNTSNNCGNTTHTFNDVGCFDVTYTTSSTLGCTASITYQDVVCVSEPPLAQFIYSPDQIMIPNTQVDFNNLSENVSTYHWNFDDMASSDLEHPSFTFPNDEIGLYDVCLTATNDVGCVDEICTKIRVVEDFIIYVPNAFTPDDDEFNQTFYPVISGINIQSYTMYIFDRWGELIFESHNKEVGWDGRFQGKYVQDGVYVWKIIFKLQKDDEKKEYYGHVTILR